MRLKVLLLGAFLAFGISAPLGADAQSRVQSIQPAWASPQQGGREGRQMMSLRDVVEIVRGRYGGELITARLEQSGDRPFYVLRWRMPNQEVQDFRVDAISGQMR